MDGGGEGVVGGRGGLVGAGVEDEEAGGNAVGGFEECGDLVEFGLVAAVEDDVEPTCGEAVGELKADAVGGAGDECPGAWVGGGFVVAVGVLVAGELGGGEAAVEGVQNAVEGAGQREGAGGDCYLGQNAEHLLGCVS